jgi:hypothetical protein
LTINDLVSLSLDKLADAYYNALPRLMEEVR